MSWLLKLLNRYEEVPNVWNESPSESAILIYSILVPSICLCGIFGNFISFLVLSKKELRCSFYVYLWVISTVDLFSCIILFMSGLARGILWARDGWLAFDALISIPLGGILSCMSSIATIFVTIDRLMYLKKPQRLCTPKFCRRKVAMKIMLCGTLVSCFFGIPYFFIYKVNEDGTIDTTSFYHSSFYFYYTWFDFVLFAILPFIFLAIGNTMLITSIKSAQKMLYRCQLSTGRSRKMKDQSKITLALIAIVFFYMIGELPTHFTNRKSAANILFGGDDEKANTSAILEIFRQTTTVLNVLHLSLKFLMYAKFCPPFYKSLKSTLLFRKDRRVRKTSSARQLKIFLITENLATNIEKALDRFDLSELGFMNVFITLKASQELPRLF